MKVKRLLVIVMLFAVLLQGCTLQRANKGISPSDQGSSQVEVESSPGAASGGSDNIIRVKWDFKNSVDENDIPLTKVYLAIEGAENKTEYIGEYTGELAYDKPDGTWGYPEGAIIVCFGWYAGAGDLLALTRDEPGSLTVKHKYIGESGGDSETEEELDQMEYETIKTITIDEKWEIEAITPDEAE